MKLQPRDQSPCLVEQRPTQSVFPSWKQKNRGVAPSSSGRTCSKIPRKECQLSFGRNWFADASHSDLGSLCWNRVVVITETAVYVLGSTLAESREKWSKHAKIGSTSFHEDHEGPRRNRWWWAPTYPWTCRALNIVSSSVHRVAAQNERDNQELAISETGQQFHPQCETVDCARN